MFIAMSQWSGSGPLASATPLTVTSDWSSFWIACCYPALWRSFRFVSVGFSLSHILPLHSWGGCWNGPTQLWSWAWVEAGLVKLPDFPHTRESSQKLTWPAHPQQSAARDWKLFSALSCPTLSEGSYLVAQLKFVCMIQSNLFFFWPWPDLLR